MLTIKTLVMFKNNGNYNFKDVNNVLRNMNFDSAKVFTKSYKGDLKKRIIDYVKEVYPKLNFKYNVTFVKLPPNPESFDEGYIDVMDGNIGKQIARLVFRYGDVLQYKNKEKSNDYYYLHKIFDGDPVQY